jgi:hypothetical protein
VSALLIKTTGSLANRLMAITAAIRIAEMTGRELLIGWTPNKFACCQLDDLFAHPFRVIEDEAYVLPGSVSLERQREGEVVKLDLDQIGDRDVTVTAHHFFYLHSDGKGHEKSLKKSEACRQFQAAFECLRPVSVVADAVAQLEGQLHGGLGLHIRRPGSTELGSGGHQVDQQILNMWSYPSDKGYINLARDLKAHLQLSGKIFLATCSLTTRQAILDAFGRDEVLFYQGRSYDLHSDVAAIQDALIDILCLSKTAVVTKRNPSTFAFFASVLGNAQQAIIYDDGLVDIKPPLSY